ncbi:VOC family protein [Terrarubrum flagellatum]|uniref:VOC family protein n=1 Tax=Terrirubrum flagellatum TaxID=2895980 RepID=UPI0031456AF5
MTFKLDHIVIAVADLDQAVADYRRLGFTVYPGGVHHGGVSHNALVIFDDGCYFELIAWLKPAPDNRWHEVLKKAGEGFVDYALLPQDTERDAAAARSRGLSIEGPIPGGRLRLDGKRLDWQIVRPHTTDLPFWCGDVTPRVLRVPDGDIRTHPNGARGVERLRIVVKDVAVSATRYIALLGPHSVSAGGAVATMQIGPSIVEVAEPWDALSLHLLETRGEGVASLALAGDDVKTLDPALTHGAALSMTL